MGYSMKVAAASLDARHGLQHEGGHGLSAPCITIYASLDVRLKGGHGLTSGVTQLKVICKLDEHQVSTRKMINASQMQFRKNQVKNRRKWGEIQAITRVVECDFSGEAYRTF